MGSESEYWSRQQYAVVARRQNPDDDVWVRMVVLWLKFDADALGLARSRAELFRFALLSGAFLCRLPCTHLLLGQMKRRLQRPLAGEEVEGHVPCWSVVAK